MQSYLDKLADLKAAGVDQVVFIASNDAFVMAAWGKANGVQDESIVSFFPVYILGGGEVTCVVTGEGGVDD